MSHEHKVVAPNGEIVWQRWTNRAIFDDRSKLTGYQSVGEDITERKQAEDALRASKEQLKIIMDSLQTGIVSIDLETHKIVNVNSAAAEMIGVAEKHIVGSVCHNYICPAEKGTCPDAGSDHEPLHQRL